MPINASAVQNDARSAHFFCFSSFNQSDITARSICTRPNPVHQACLHICPENCTAHLNIRAGGCNPNSKCCDPSTHHDSLSSLCKRQSQVHQACHQICLESCTVRHLRSCPVCCHNKGFQTRVWFPCSS